MAAISATIGRTPSDEFIEELSVEQAKSMVDDSYIPVLENIPDWSDEHSPKELVLQPEVMGGEKIIKVYLKEEQ